jgi:S1-C subfamily serine protease
MRRRLAFALPLVLGTVLAAGLLGPAAAVPRPQPPRLHPSRVAAEPSHVQRVAPAIVGLSARADAEAASSARLGSRRFGSGAIFDPRGYAVTVSYVLMDAVDVEARLRDGRTVAARPVALDLETGLGVVKLQGPGPWPTVTLGESEGARAGTATATVGVDEDNALVAVTGTLQAIRPFSSPWEYMLERAFIVQPGSPSWGGSVVVDTSGQVIAMASLRLGAPPHVNLAIPIEAFAPVKDELIAAGRVTSRRPRPWLGLYTSATREGVVVEDFAPAGPARAAGFRKGDRIVGVNGVTVGTQEDFYRQLWRGEAGDVIRVAVVRAASIRMIAVRSIDRYRLLRR